MASNTFEINLVVFNNYDKNKRQLFRTMSVGRGVETGLSSGTVPTVV